jgi:hypothetical protein
MVVLTPQSIRFHFEARDAKAPFMYVFAEPVTEDEAEAIQNRGEAEQREFARSVVGLERDEVQSAWQNLQNKVDNEVGQTEPAAEVGESEKPVLGWTLTVRNKVNGEYVERPQDLHDEDDWKIEYHIKEIGDNMRWKAYKAVQERRRQLASNDVVNDSLAHFRDLIKRYTTRGRAWRDKQDRMLEERGVQVFKPLGPGSGA